MRMAQNSTENFDLEAQSCKDLYCVENHDMHYLVQGYCAYYYQLTCKLHCRVERREEGCGFRVTDFVAAGWLDYTFGSGVPWIYDLLQTVHESWSCFCSGKGRDFNIFRTISVYNSRKDAKGSLQFWNVLLSPFLAVCFRDLQGTNILMLRSGSLTSQLGPPVVYVWGVYFSSL